MPPHTRASILWLASTASICVDCNSSILRMVMSSLRTRWASAN